MHDKKKKKKALITIVWRDSSAKLSQWKLAPSEGKLKYVGRNNGVKC